MRPSQRPQISSGRRRLLALAGVIAAVLFVVISNLAASSGEYDGQITFLADETFLPVLLQDIENAEKSISCALYMFKTDGGPTELVLAAMINALEKGVEVEIIFDIENKDDLSTQYNTHTGKILEKAGAVIRYDDPDRRLHTKMCVIDDYISFIGSHNYTYSAMKRNSEVTVRIRSSDIAQKGRRYIKGL